MEFDAIRRKVRNRLKARAEENFRKGVFRFFKEQINPLGVRLPEVRKLARELDGELGGKLAFGQLFRLSEEFQKSEYFEEQILGVYLIERHLQDFTPETFRTFERWIDAYVSNWAHCDLFCTHSVYYCIRNSPALVRRLPKWTSSKNRWKRRAAAVTLIIPAKKGMFLREILRIAGRLAYDEDEMVQKGTGWLLREAAKAHRKEVLAFLLKHKSAGRVLLRYATEKFPQNLRERVLR